MLSIRVFLDLKILISTFKNVITASGINSDINITMEKFNGKN